MEREPIIQFVSFETSVDSSSFITQWEQYARDMSDDQEIKLQQEVGIKKRTKYLSQHKCHDDEFEFVFKKERRSAHFPEVEMSVQQLGGYITLQLQCDHDADANENKIFVFINKHNAEFDGYRQLSNYRYLNIYQAYFENSLHQYILEFFARQEEAAELLAQIKLQGHYAELGMYKECMLQDV